MRLLKSIEKGVDTNIETEAKKITAGLLGKSLLWVRNNIKKKKDIRNIYLLSGGSMGCLPGKKQEWDEREW